MANITRVERKILANQYAILEKIDPERAEQYAELREVLDDGFQAEYGDVLRDVYDEPDTMTAEEQLRGGCHANV